MAVATPSWFCLAGCCTIALLGCDAQSQTETGAEEASVKVVYQSNPLANVLIVLKQPADGKPLAHAISARSGRASFQSLPNPEPEQYVVSMESNSDGGWILDSNIMAKFCDSLRLKPFSQVPNQLIELPNRAVRSLSPSH
ncbi:hypothetical protein [Aporhodopirellula aestuarii]|uniref:Uncharacterized protein n=1 Tax=Aporhodopirellula aestuarii TaxID=2950107 RepID=A0ABT0U8C1_9BACT|nr:hypothetical protein [Aporhodopirellula aestuarii]MCM2373219.1 hypothetical protein [Aporhodopirellula aestuarii]